MKNDEEIARKWKRTDDENVRQICELIESYEKEVHDYLADIVASLCDIDIHSMKCGKEVHCARARWLFWYAYRYMTNDTFEHISEMSKRTGMDYAHTSVNVAVNKMSGLIVGNTIWTKRWTILKRIIKAREREEEFDFGQKETQIPSDKVYINIPRELKNKVEIKYED